MNSTTDIEVYSAGTVSVDPGIAEQTLQIGDSIKLAPQSTPTTACQSYYTYTTSNAKIAKVYTDGTILAVGNGKAKITIIAGDGSGVKTVYNVKVTQPVTQITVTGQRDCSVLASGTKLQMLAAVNADAANRKVVWSLAGENAGDYATINAATGMLSAKKTVASQQTVTVVATAADGSNVTGTKDITIYPAITGITLNPTKMTLGTQAQGQYNTTGTFTVTAAPVGVYAENYTITASKPSVATATYDDETGAVTVTAHAKGKTDIKVMANDGSGKYAVCKITVVQPVTELTIASKTGLYGLTSGQRLQMTAAVNASASNKTVNWWFTEDDMSNYAVLDSKTGLIKAKTVTEKQAVSVFASAADDGEFSSASKDIIIYPDRTAAIKVTEQNSENAVTKTTLCTGVDIGLLVHLNSFEIHTYNSSGQSSTELCPSVTASSSNAAVATASTYEYEGKQYVDIVSGTTPGKATITLKANDNSGKTARVTVTVVNPVRSLNIKSATNQYTAAYGTSLQMLATTTANATNRKIVWSLAEGGDAYATITQSGLLRPKRGLTTNYTVTVYADTQDGSQQSVYKTVDLYARASSIAINGLSTVTAGTDIELTVDAVSAAASAARYKITYTTGSAKVYYMNDEGNYLKVTGLKKGTTTITATALDGSGLTATRTIQVMDADIMDYYENHDYKIKWPILWIVTKEIDADGTNAAGETVHAHAVMPEEEQDYFLNTMSESFEKTVEAFTGGRVDVQITKLLYKQPVTQLSGDAWNCLCPNSFDAKTQKKFEQYNSVICTARFNENGQTMELNQSWLGLSSGILGQGYGFCQVGSNGDYTVYKKCVENPYEAEPWIHEWTHTLESACEQYGGFVPCPDNAGDYGYTKRNPDYPLNGYYHYYRDALNGTVYDPNDKKEKGLNPATWKMLAYMYDHIRKK